MINLTLVRHAFRISAELIGVVGCLTKDAQPGDGTGDWAWGLWEHHMGVDINCGDEKTFRANLRALLTDLAERL